VKQREKTAPFDTFKPEVVKKDLTTADVLKGPVTVESPKGIKTWDLSKKTEENSSRIKKGNCRRFDKAPTKKVYKSVQKKFHALKPDQQSEIYMKKAKRDPKSFYFDKKKFGKK